MLDAPQDRLRSVFEDGVALHRADDLRGAVSHYLRVLAERPNLWFVTDNLAQALLALGDFRAGFSLYDIRFHRPRQAVPRPTLPFPEWRGEPILGKSVLIWPEQGFGDQIMFARFAASLAEVGAKVTLAATPPLFRLFSTLSTPVVAATSDVPLHDFWVMAGSIPGRLGLSKVPSAPPFPIFRQGGEGLGVAVRGDPQHPNDANRSLDSVAAQRLLGLPGVIDLLPESTGARDFLETADIIAGLDRVISVDTSIAHLAAAMGKPVSLLLPRVGIDWRWMLGRSPNPWYPTVTAFRQQPGEGWLDCVDRLLSGCRLE